MVMGPVFFSRYDKWSSHGLDQTLDQDQDHGPNMTIMLIQLVIWVGVKIIPYYMTAEYNYEYKQWNTGNN